MCTTSSSSTNSQVTEELVDGDIPRKPIAQTQGLQSFLPQTTSHQVPRSTHRRGDQDPGSKVAGGRHSKSPTSSSLSSLRNKNRYLKLQAEMAHPDMCLLQHGGIQLGSDLAASGRLQNKHLRHKQLTKLECQLQHHAHVLNKLHFYWNPIMTCTQNKTTQDQKWLCQRVAA